MPIRVKARLLTKMRKNKKRVEISHPKKKHVFVLCLKQAFDRVLGEQSVQDVMKWTRELRYWRNHVEKMGSERLEKWAKTQKSDTKRSVGRPPNRWYES